MLQVELPYLVVQVCLFAPIAYYMVGFKAAAGSFLFFLMTFWLSLLVFHLLWPDVSGGWLAPAAACGGVAMAGALAGGGAAGRLASS